MQVTLTVTLQVESYGGLSDDLERAAAVEAVENAIQQGEDNGFSHAYAGHASIRLESVEVKQ